MNIEQIATRFTDRPNAEPGDVAIDHPYRTRWWLPVIGPTATCALTHLATDTMNSDWQLTPASELAVNLGLGKGTATHAALGAGLGARESALTIRSGLRAGMLHPRRPPDRSPGDPVPPRVEVGVEIDL